MSKNQNFERESNNSFILIKNQFHFKKNQYPDPWDINFKWPEFKSDRERIKAYSKRFKDVTVKEAFEKVFNLDLSGVSEEVNDVPKELAVGDIISIKLRNIGKDRVDFDTANYKSPMQSAVNLYKYARFKNNIPTESVNVRVTKVDKDKVTVDPISPMIEEWLNPIIKNTNVQKDMKKAEGQHITVKDLQLTRGGFIGKAVIPNVSKFVGEDYTMDAFIPGSQIVLNITDNFEQFIGKSTEAFVLNYMQKPGTSGMSLICSTKEWLKFKGETTMIELFNSWCDGTELWKKIEKTVLDGKVTGIINSSKKCGVFVEIPEMNITGMVAVKPEELVNYKPYDKVKVKLTGFEEEMYFNQTMKQMQHVEPYVIKDDKLERCSLKPILKFEK